jgi:hypothetical protein
MSNILSYRKAELCRAAGALTNKTEPEMLQSIGKPFFSQKGFILLKYILPFPISQTHFFE